MYISFAYNAHSFVQSVAVLGLHANQQTSSLQWRLLNRIHNRQPTVFISIDLFTLDYKCRQQRNWHEVCFPPWIAVRPSRQFRHAHLLPAYAHIPHPEGGPLQWGNYATTFQLTTCEQWPRQCGVISQIHAADCSYKPNSECLKTEFKFINRSLKPCRCDLS